MHLRTSIRFVPMSRFCHRIPTRTGEPQIRHGSVFTMPSTILRRLRPPWLRVIRRPSAANNRAREHLRELQGGRMLAQTAT